MKIAIISDIHFGVRADSKWFAENQKKFFDNVFFPILKKRGIDNVFHLGDLWESRTNVSWLTKKRAEECLFKPLQDNGIKFTTILGNHDVYYRNTNNVNGVDYLGEQYRDTIFVERSMGVYSIGGIKIGMISWINKENYEESIEWLQTVDADVVCGHFDIAGFEMVPGHVSTNGLPHSIFKRFALVMSGHFHVRSRIGNVVYVSNPFQTNWGEVNMDKGFHIFDTETLELEFVKNPYTMFREHVIGDNFDVSDFYDKYARIIAPIGSSRSQIDLAVDALRPITIGLQVIEEQEDLGESKGNYECVEGVWGIVDGYIDEVYGGQDSLDVVKLKASIRDLYEEASNRIEVI